MLSTLSPYNSKCPITFQLSNVHDKYIHTLLLTRRRRKRESPSYRFRSSGCFSCLFGGVVLLVEEEQKKPDLKLSAKGSTGQWYSGHNKAKQKAENLSNL